MGIWGGAGWEAMWWWAIGYELLAISSYWLSAISYWLLAIGSYQEVLAFGPGIHHAIGIANS
jgi:hypothetical protein